MLDVLVPYAGHLGAHVDQEGHLRARCRVGCGSTEGASKLGETLGRDLEHEHTTVDSVADRHNLTVYEAATTKRNETDDLSRIWTRPFPCPAPREDSCAATLPAYALLPIAAAALGNCAIFVSGASAPIRASPAC